MPARGSRRLERALAALGRGLSTSGAPWMCIGGVAVVAHGVRRNTHDVDAAVRGDAIDPKKLVAHLATHGILPRIPDAAAFAAANQVFLARHASTGVDLDISFAWLSFEHEALDRAVTVAFGAVRSQIARPEDLVIYKLLAGRPVDLQDAESLLAFHGHLMDLARVRRVLGEIAQIEGAEDGRRVLDALLERIPRRRPRRLPKKRATPDT